MQVLQHLQGAKIPLEKNSFGSPRNHSCTAWCTSSPERNFFPPIASLSGPDIWKSLGARSGEYGGWGRHSKCRSVNFRPAHPNLSCKGKEHPVTYHFLHTEESRCIVFSTLYIYIWGSVDSTTTRPFYPRESVLVSDVDEAERVFGFGTGTRKLSRSHRHWKPETSIQ